MKFYLPLLFFLFAFISMNAQDTIPISRGNIQDLEIGFGPIRNVIKLDPITRLPIGNIPFDRVFILRVYFDPKAEEDFRDIDVKGFYLVNENGKTIPLTSYMINSVDPAAYDASDTFLKVYPNAIDVVIPPLDPNSDYKIFYANSAIKFGLSYIEAFKLFYEGKENEGIALAQKFKKNNNNDKAIATGNSLKEYYIAHKSAIDQIFIDNKDNISERNNKLFSYMETNKSVTMTIGGESVTVDLFTEVKELSKLNTQQFLLKTSSALRIVADGGIIYAGWQKGFNTVTPYFGINISLRPMDTDIPFKTLVKYNRIKFYQRFTANLGITINSIAKDNYRANLFSNNNVMIGLGYKVSHVLNLNFGGLLYNNINPNPLVATKSIGIAPYAGISINLLIKDALGDIAKIFSK
ncbi:hypothetical protein [Flavobacterium sp. LC2016-01]|uniref:hypothetical protein n=1 Tax=Flavobacterium sp. LC2016-01 TaxID=2675876 RepID=UPI0012BAF0BE|nr:hypothetical protein [Flavobacterium sp. LC2016-01]MTH15817.1 hypothetical protein [Flavobacterium sp. LC2016-01]